MGDDNQPRGHPLGESYGSVKSIRLTPADGDLLRALAAECGCSEAAVMRRLLRDAARARRGSGLPLRLRPSSGEPPANEIVPSPQAPALTLAENENA